MFQNIRLRMEIRENMVMFSRGIDSKRPSERKWELDGNRFSPVITWKREKWFNDVVIELIPWMHEIGIPRHRNDFATFCLHLRTFFALALGKAINKLSHFAENYFMCWIGVARSDYRTLKMNWQTLAESWTTLKGLTITWKLWISIGSVFGSGCQFLSSQVSESEGFRKNINVLKKHSQSDLPLEVYRY